MMDYNKLAEHFYHETYQLKKYGHQRIIDESMQGEIFTLLYIKSRNTENKNTENKNTKSINTLVTPGDISEEMSISSARVATILNNLEKKGLVERKIDTIDRRRILVALTRKGEEQAENSNRKVINQIEKMLKLLGEEDAKEFVRITARIVDLAPKVVED